MKRIFTLILILISWSAYSQETGDIDSPLGYRIKRNGLDYLIYADSNLNPIFKDYRKINFQVYFRKVKTDTKKIGDKTYQLITIPGSSSKKDQENNAKESSQNLYPRRGLSVSSQDYDQNFWIDIEVIKTDCNIEHYKYENQPFTGLLTAPFKLRLKASSAPESLIDGDFNIAPFFGWKYRISSSKPFYLAPFVFAGMTTLSYNSSNNDSIKNPKITENAAGITYGAGLSFRFGDISPGIIFGLDHGLGNHGSGFLYSDKLWISFSINYDFLKPKPTATDKNKN